MNSKLDELVHRSAAKAAGVTVIKRFSGGGTVAVDSDTVFATLISSEAAIPEVRLHAIASLLIARQVTVCQMLHAKCQTGAA